MLINNNRGKKTEIRIALWKYGLDAGGCWTLLSLSTNLPAQANISVRPPKCQARTNIWFFDMVCNERAYELTRQVIEYRIAGLINPTEKEI